MRNERERRVLEMMENHLLLMAAIKATGSNMPPEYFGYVASVTGFTGAGVTRSAVITIQADAWFVAQYVSVGVILPNASSFGDQSQMTDGGNILLQITDTGAGQELFSQPQGFAGFPSINVAGSPITAAAGIPYAFPTPRLLPPQTNVKVDFTQFGFNAPANPLPLSAWIMINGARVPLGAME